MSTYDAVVIGVGHNVLCLAAYLQCRLRTAVVKRRHEQGGGADTEEPVLPAFRHNRHAQCMEFFDVMPMIRDFGLGEAAVRPLGPEQVLVREDLLVHDQRVQPTDLMGTLGIGSTFINMNNASRLADGDAARGVSPTDAVTPSTLVSAGNPTPTNAGTARPVPGPARARTCRCAPHHTGSCWRRWRS